MVKVKEEETVTVPSPTLSLMGVWLNAKMVYWAL